MTIAFPCANLRPYSRATENQNQKKGKRKMYENEKLITRFENGEYIMFNECVGLDVFHGTYEEVGKFISDYFDEIDSY